MLHIKYVLVKNLIGIKIRMELDARLGTTLREYYYRENRRIKNMKDYNKILELQNLTIDDCYSLYRNDIVTIINDGIIINLIHENK